MTADLDAAHVSLSSGALSDGRDLRSVKEDLRFAYAY